MLFSCCLFVCVCFVLFCFVLFCFVLFVFTCFRLQTVKYWSFAVRKLPGGETALTLQLSRTLTVGDDALSVCFSGDGKLVAVGLLDATVAVFFNDTHKLFLALYGHKLPVLSVSISSDSRLLVSGSADKNVKIWGLDFGDCHRSMFADDSVTRVQFLPSTHYFVTTSKDGTIKYDQEKTVYSCLILSPASASAFSASSSSSSSFFFFFFMVFLLKGIGMLIVLSVSLFFEDITLRFGVWQ